MYVMRLLLCIASALILMTASVLSEASPTSSSWVPSETPIIISQVANCINKTYIYCSRRELTGNYKTDLSDAVDGMAHFCLLHQIDPKQYYRTKAGRTQIYMCNYGDSLLECNTGEYWAANYLLDDKCGEGNGGWMYRKTEDHEWSVGRDPTINENDFRSECGMW